MNQVFSLKNILFLDIETVSGHANYSELPEILQELWHKKCKSILKRYEETIPDEEIAQTYKDKAAIFAEFGKIVCISVGILYFKADTLRVRLKSFANHDEKILLQDFFALLANNYADTFRHGLCGHNIKEFDIPYICRRATIHQLHFPPPLQIAGKKPWECKHLIDTLELWKFGDYKNYTSLKLLAAILGFPSPKDDIDGSEVGRVFWDENDLERIASYCEKDVLATIQLYLRYQRIPILEAEQVEFV